MTVPWTAFQLPRSDDAVLKYLDDEGMSIEPEYYVPVLPMILVNGGDGSATSRWTALRREGAVCQTALVRKQGCRFRALRWICG